jgi:hypothetical protein
LKRLLLSIASLLPASGAHARDLVEAMRGELPIILAAPHGGRNAVPGCDLRTPTGSRFVTAADFNSDVLARGIAAELERITGKNPTWWSRVSSASSSTPTAALTRLTAAPAAPKLMRHTTR